MTMIRTLGIILGLLLLWCAIVLGAPPPGADESLAPWFQSLMVPPGNGAMSNTPCCSLADCRNAQYRATATGYEAFIDRKTFGSDAPDAWLPVPGVRVLHRKDNPTGEAVICWYQGEIRCFVAGLET
jgi:hypothetical protein